MNESGHEQVQQPDNTPFFPLRKDARALAVFSVLFLLYIGFGLVGYGTDCDTYLMLRSGHDLLLKGTYHPSRPPGYLVPETILGGVSLLGGFYATNFISAVLGTATLFIFWRLLSIRWSSFEAIAATLLVGLNPYYVIASSSSMDYVYSLFFGIAGIYLLQFHKPFLAAPLFSLALGSRLSNALLVGVVYAYFLYVEFANRNVAGLVRTFLSGVVALFLACLLFIPAFHAAGNSMGFLTYAIGKWAFFGYLSRFVYKNLYLFGLLSTCVMVGIACWKALEDRSIGKRLLSPVPLAALASIVIQEALFFKIPIDISYILPLLFTIVPLWMFLCRPTKFMLNGLIILTIVFGFVVNIDILDRKYNATETEAIDAKVGVFFRPGVVVADALERKHWQREYEETILNKEVDASPSLSTGSQQ